MVEVSEQVKFLVWRIDLICGDLSLGEVDIKRGIFQGDSL